MGQGGHRLRPAGALFRAAGDRLPGQRPNPLLPPGAGEGFPGEGFRLVPFESVGGSGMLPAFRPDSVRLEPAGTSLACYVALWQRGPACPGFPAGDFQALYGPDQFPELSPTR